MTNAERIRNMSDEDLIEFLFYVYVHREGNRGAYKYKLELLNVDTGEFDLIGKDKKDILEWLSKEHNEVLAKSNVRR